MSLSIESKNILQPCLKQEQCSLTQCLGKHVPFFFVNKKGDYLYELSNFAIKILSVRKYIHTSTMKILFLISAVLVVNTLAAKTCLQDWKMHVSNFNFIRYLISYSFRKRFSYILNFLGDGT